MNNELSEKELATLIRLSKKVLWSDISTRKKLQEHKVNVVPANFYSNIPLIEDVENSFEYKEGNDEIYNIDIFDQDVISGFIEEMSTYAAEFNPVIESENAAENRYFWNNSQFSYSDAMSYYCVIRHFKPDHILEIGAGFSTLVANEALLKNGKGKITIIEPYPRDFLAKLECVDNIIESFVQDIPVDELVSLVDSVDIWFIDSTHTVKVGSDCLYIYLLIMPRLSKDIIVHAHDIFLPYAFPKNKALDKHIYWTEQYLLYAYMLDNPRVEVLFGSAYANKKLNAPLKKLMDGKYPSGGASIWFKLSALVK